MRTAAPSASASRKRLPPLTLAAALLASASGCSVSDAGPAGQTPPPPPAETAAPAASAAGGGAEEDGPGNPAAEAPALPVLREETPPLVGIDGWLQSDVSSLEELRGSVVVVEFWTFGCYNCRNRIPHTQELYAEHRGRGLEIVGIHSPEFDYERAPEAVEEALGRLGVDWPVALDTERRTFRAWQGRPAYWPRTYVLDQRGRVRFDHIGEGAYEELEAAVVRLLAEGP